MSRLEAAARRLESAVARLERALAQSAGRIAEAEDAAIALAAIKADYAALEETTAQVASRLDATIERLDEMLKA